MSNERAIWISVLLVVLAGAMVLLRGDWFGREGVPSPAPPPVVVIDDEEKKGDEEPPAINGPIQLYRKVSALIDYAQALQRASQAAADELSKAKLSDEAFEPFGDIPAPEPPPRPTPEPIPDPDPVRWQIGKSILVFANRDQTQTQLDAAELSLAGENVYLVPSRLPELYQRFGVKTVPLFIVTQDGMEVSRSRTKP